jgi:hypothetical protein
MPLLKNLVPRAEAASRYGAYERWSLCFVRLRHSASPPLSAVEYLILLAFCHPSLKVFQHFRCVELGYTREK